MNILVVIAVVLLFIAYVALMTYVDRKRKAMAEAMAADEAEMEEMEQVKNDPPVTAETMSFVRATIGAVRETITPPRKPSVRMELIGRPVLFKNGRPHTGMVVGSNRHGTRLRIACLINGMPSNVSRRARKVRVLVN